MSNSVEHLGLVLLPLVFLNMPIHIFSVPFMSFPWNHIESTWMHKKQSRVSTNATNTKPNTKQFFEPPQETLTKLVWREVVNHCPTLLLQETSLVTFRSCNIFDRTCLIPSGSLWLWPHWQSNCHLAHSRFGRIRTVVLWHLCVPKSTQKHNCMKLHTGMEWNRSKISDNAFWVLAIKSWIRHQDLTDIDMIMM